MIENLPNEIWKPIIGFPKYQISNMGRIQGQKGLVVPYNKMNTKYKLVGLYDENLRSHKFSVHRLVAKHFLPNPNNMTEINHIDEDPSNNVVSNLEWCNRDYNLHYGTDEFIGTYDSITKVAEEIGATVSNICATLHGRRNHSKGYYLKFHE